MAEIPSSVIGAASKVLERAYTHSGLNALFPQHGFPGDVPDGNKLDKCLAWLRRANAELPDPLKAFGRLIAEFMDRYEPPASPVPWFAGDPEPDPRDMITGSLAQEGLGYLRGGRIVVLGLAVPSATLEERLKRDGLLAMESEFKRAYDSIEADPNTSATAACAILESVCKTFLEEKGGLPNKQVLGTLWSETLSRLGLSPANVADVDLKKILTALYSAVDGIASLRTHVGNAHGRSEAAHKAYNLKPRRARLAVHAAHTLAMFILETREARDAAAPPSAPPA